MTPDNDMCRRARRVRKRATHLGTLLLAGAVLLGLSGCGCHDNGSDDTNIISCCKSTPFPDLVYVCQTPDDLRY